VVAMAERAIHGGSPPQGTVTFLSTDIDGSTSLRCEVLPCRHFLDP
jgi:hypothetical protein